jgi:uncharacterized protein YdeI (YjbR/CyaY-like superfamily)
MMKSDLNLDAYFQNAKKWQEEIQKLRTIVLGRGLEETMKWGHPCYTFQDSNIILIHEFKEYCALLFFKGALLADSKGMLIQQTKNTQASRQLRFTTVQEIIEQEALVKSYIDEAIEVEKSGLKVEFKETEEFLTPDELQTRFDESPAFKAAFEALTPGRQRAYKLYFSGAKQSKTREARIEKYREHILAGRGLND